MFFISHNTTTYQNTGRLRKYPLVAFLKNLMLQKYMGAELAGSLIYDTTGIESYAAENNPQFFSSKLRQAKHMSKTNPSTDPYRAVYGLLSDCAAANPAEKQQYMSGHFCYAQKAGLLTNGLGIVRHIAFFDDYQGRPFPRWYCPAPLRCVSRCPS